MDEPPVDLGIDYETRYMNARLNHLEAKTKSLVESSLVSRRLAFQECLRTLEGFFYDCFADFRTALSEARLSEEQSKALLEKFTKACEEFGKRVDEEANKRGELEENGSDGQQIQED